ncbi:RNA polymerase sigma factor [Flavobacterium sp.]|uniref:RNA polymerase sigma factor n=1 Tax=Flavobacterium sp. TaxID=239 RepID=UPI002D09DD74|nr:RNA polymerase sigma factor [Flavobacterium sp.]HSD07391.1 RNA polymerase sigma factor [Flavobacterium sp.]
MKVINLHQEENEVIALAVQNNRQAQQWIYSKYSPRMLSVCRQYIKDLQLAEDVMITAFMKVFVHLDRFEKRGSFEGWIRRTMINECISYIRVQKKVQFIEDSVDFEEMDSETEIQFSVEDIQNLIDSLPDGYKVVFNLFVIEGFKHKEIASMLGITEGTSKSQFAHARRILKSKISNLKNQEKNY